MNCICCSSKNSVHLEKEKGLSYRRCSNCSLIYVTNIPRQHFEKSKNAPGDISTWKEWARQRQKIFRKELSYLRKCRSGGKLLDVGCGVGAFLSLIKKDYNYLGIEPDSDLAFVGKEMLKLNIECKFLSDVKDRYDIITFWDVLEHVPSPDKELERANGLLNSGGLLVVRVPNSSYALLKYNISRFFGISFAKGAFGSPHHLYHFSKKSIFLLLQRKRFRIIRYKPSRSIAQKKNGFVTSFLYYFGLVLYYGSFGRVNIVIDHLIYAKKY